MKFVDIVKQIATIIHLIGYGLNGMGLTPINIYFFIVGIFYGLAQVFFGKIKP